MAAKASSYARYGRGWPALRQLVFRAKGRRCWWCGRFATTVDHVIPRAIGGRHELANLVPSCARCNYSRGASMGNRLRGSQVRNYLYRVPETQPGPSRDW